MATSATTLKQNEVAAIQKDWKNREFVEVVKLNMLQVSNRKPHWREEMPCRGSKPPTSHSHFTDIGAVTRASSAARPTALYETTKRLE
jgi:hypothetical protein